MRGVQTMKLMTVKLLKRFASKGYPGSENTIVLAHYFTPFNNWDWYALEYDPVDKRFFGYVKGLYPEYGYFSLDELEKANEGRQLKLIERDRYWVEKDIEEIV